MSTAAGDSPARSRGRAENLRPLRKPAVPAVTLTPEAFRALVADLKAEMAAADLITRTAIVRFTRQPEASARYPWTETPLLLAEAAALSGYDPQTLREYARNKRGETPYFPAVLNPSKRLERRYRAGDLAVFIASRNTHGGRGGTGPRKRPGKPPVPVTVPRHRVPRRARSVAWAAGLIARDPGITVPRLAAAAAAAGMWWPQGALATFIDDARAEAAPAVLGGFESTRPDGMATLSEAAAMFGVSADMIKTAVRNGLIRATPQGPRKPWLTDPSRLRFHSEKPARNYKRKTPRAPVDKDHPYAVPMPGERTPKETRP